jgi:hypothetical protein
VPISPKTTPMLPSVRAQKPEVTGPSWVSVDVMLAVMKGENASSLELIRRLLTLPVRLSIGTPP